MIFAGLEEIRHVGFISYEYHIVSIEEAVYSTDKLCRGNIRGYRLWTQKAMQLVNVYRIQKRRED